MMKSRRYKVFIYGHGRKYDEVASLLRGYDGIVIDIQGIITSDAPKYRYFDGLPCFKAEDVLDDEFDFIIVTPDAWKEIVLYLNEKGVPDDKIVLRRPFYLPYFDLEKYLQVKMRNISLLSQNCLAGIVYSHLGLRVNTPTYNCICKNKTFFKLLSNPPKYLGDRMILLDEELRIKRKRNKGSWGLDSYTPQGVLENHKNMVWSFPHTDNIDVSIDYWNKKREMVNMSELFALCYIQGEDDLLKFDGLKMNKIGFSIDDFNRDNVVYIREWRDGPNIQRTWLQNQFAWSNYIMHQMTSGRDIQCRINWINLLNGDKDYMRY